MLYPVSYKRPFYPSCFDMDMQLRAPGTFKWLLLSGVLVSLASIWLWYDYRHTLVEAGIQQTNVARLFETHTSYVIANTDLVLDRVIDEVRDHDIMGNGADKRWPVLAAVAKKLPVSGRLWLYRADGSAVMASHMRHSSNNANDREYFTVQRQPNLGLFVGETVIGKTTGKRVFNISRRLDAPDGTFAGVAMAALEIDVFTRVVSELRLGNTAAYTIVRSDGAVIVRHPDAGATGRRFHLKVLDEMKERSSGLFTTVSAIDGVSRLAAFRKHTDLPLAIIVSVSHDEILGPWRRRALSLSGAVALLLVVTGWLSVAARRAEKNKQNMSMRMQTVLDTVAEGICGIDAMGNITFINPAGARLFGYEQDDLVGKNLHETTHHSLPDGTHFLVEKCPIHNLLVEGGEKLGIDHFWKRDGQYFTVEYAATWVREHDKPQGVVLAFRDISERLQSERDLHTTLAALSEAATFNQAILDSIGAHVAILDGQGGIIAVNQAWGRFALENGLDAQAVGVGANYLDSITAAAEAGDESAMRANEGIRAVIEGKQREFYTGYPCHSPEVERWFFMRVLRVEGLSPMRVVVTHENISHVMAAQTALAKSERFLRSLIDIIPGMVSYWTAELRCGFANSAYLEWFGMTSEQIRGASIETVLGDELYRCKAPFIQAALQGERQRFESVLTNADGNVKDTWTHYIPDISDGAVCGFFVLISDISELKQIQLQLEKRTVEAEAANLAKSRFLATMSHEIRTPMNGILGMAQLLLMNEVGDAERRDYARIIFNSGQTLLTLLNDILDLSKIEAGKVELESLVFQPAQLIHEAVTLFSERAQAKGLKVEAVWLGSQDRRYRGDPLRLRQMLSNLVSNAIKFTSRGFIRVEAREIESGGGDALLEFSVADSGVGIPLDKQAALFKPFTQADASTTREYGGSGLGLSIVRNLAKLMDGEVGIDSEAGRGARIWFRIRANHTDDIEECRTARSHLVDTETAQLQHRSFSILVVEDNVTNRIVVESMLKRQGIHFESVENGREAVNLIMAGTQPDLVLMDCQMPVMDGYEATRKIRQWEIEGERSRTPVIALTASAFAEDREHCFAAGMDDYLTKPLDIHDLKTLLDKWLRRD